MNRINLAGLVIALGIGLTVVGVFGDTPDASTSGGALGLSPTLSLQVAATGMLLLGLITAVGLIVERLD